MKVHKLCSCHSDIDINVLQYVQILRIYLKVMFFPPSKMFTWENLDSSYRLKLSLDCGVNNRQYLLISINGHTLTAFYR